MTFARCNTLVAILTTFIFLLTVNPLLAQRGAAQDVAITVHDSSDAVVDGAIVVISKGATERRGTTGVDGVARFNNLESGEWLLEVRKEGFAIAEQQIAVATGAVNATVTLALPTLSESISVETRIGALDTTATSATRLDLSLKELPATLSVVTQDMMQERGASTAMDAIDVAGGTLTSTGLGGQLPGYQTRGFSGNSIMNDGIRQNASVQSSRPQDSFLMDRVEVLKGPASLLAGEGGTAGTVNYVSKTPKQKFGFDSLLSYGSFAARRIGMGVTGPLRDNLLARFDGVYSDGGGYARPSHTKLRAMTSSLLWTPFRQITFKAQGKYTDDNLQAYYSTPFINGEPDPRMRYFNYNLADSFSRGHNNFGRLDTDINLDNGWRIHNGTYAATQRLDYRNMESYSYNAATQKVDVSSYFLIWRHDLLVGNQLDARKTVDILGRSVTFITGFELQRNKMQRARTPLDGGTVRYSVDPFNPVLPNDPKLNYLRVPDVKINNKTFYAEAQAKLSRRWQSVLGLRTEEILVDYQLVLGGPNLNRKFHPTTGRVGLVFTATENVSLYGSYSRSIEPANQFVTLTGCCGTATFFDLTPGRQFETGIKGTWLGGKLEATAAYFDIEKSNIPTKTLINDVPTDQLIGRQNARGTEFAVTTRPYSSFFLAGDLTFTDAVYSEFNETVAGVVVSRTGNAPTGVPVVIWSVTPTQRVGPVSFAFSVRQIGKRWANTANTLRRPSYQTVDSWVSIRLPRGSVLTLRGRNLTDDMRLAGAGATSGRLAPPRSFEAQFTSSF